jgi:hypothetical protein
MLHSLIFCIRIRRKIIPPETGKSPYYEGQIVLGNQWLDFDLYLDHWTLEEYHHQWHEGIERLKTHDTTCFVTDMGGPEQGIGFWAVYKQGNRVVALKTAIGPDNYIDMIGEKPYTPDTCYNYVRPYEEELTYNTDEPLYPLPLDVFLKGKVGHWTGHTLFSIRFLDPSKPAYRVNNIPVYTGEIVIGSFSEYIRPCLNFWSIADYQRQWRTGIERLKTHDTSCLIVWVDGKNKIRGVESWALYKEGDKVIFQNHVCWSRRAYKKLFKNQPITPDNCYDYIRPRNPNGCAQEWSIPLTDLLASLES